MADITNIQEGNVPGRYFTDTQCIDCDLCRQTAPQNFKRNDDGGYSVVYSQPTTPEEEKSCEEARDACPVEAIGVSDTVLAQ